MCCSECEKATLQAQQRKHLFVAYKVIWVHLPALRRHPPSLEVRSIYGRGHMWKQGINEAHWHTREYSSIDPHGFHFFFRKKDAIGCLGSLTDFLLQVQVDPKDIFAVEPPGHYQREGVALKVTVTQCAWGDLMRRIKKEVPTFSGK